TRGCPSGTVGLPAAIREFSGHARRGPGAGADRCQEHTIVSAQPVAVTIYHNPACGTARNTLALIRNAGVEPTVIEYLKIPPDRATLEALIQRMGIHPRELLRQKGTPYE